MKIAYLVHDYHRAGGHSRYVAELATRFCREHEVHVFANRIEPDKASGIHFHRLPALRTNALTTVLSFALPATFRVGREFDIVHSQGFCGFRGNVFTGHICNRAWHRALTKLEGGVTRRERIFNSIAGVLELSVYRRGSSNTVIAISNRVAEDIRDLYGCSAAMRVIHHGVDTTVFHPSNRSVWRDAVRARFPLGDGELVFLFVGDMRKGGPRCIEALSKTAKGHLIFVSRSEPHSFRKLAAKLGVADRITFAGPAERIEQMYAAADAFVLPTPYDAFGMVVSEAMASGLPVIVSREAGAAELIEHGKNGLVLENVTDVDELARHMKLLAGDSPLRHALGSEARKTTERMSWDSVAQKTMEVYEQVLARREAA